VVVHNKIEHKKHLLRTVVLIKVFLVCVFAFLCMRDIWPVCVLSFHAYQFVPSLQLLKQMADFTKPGMTALLLQYSGF
jgi:hypothetical protein